MFELRRLQVALATKPLSLPELREALAAPEDADLSTLTSVPTNYDTLHEAASVLAVPSETETRETAAAELESRFSASIDAYGIARKANYVIRPV